MTERLISASILWVVAAVALSVSVVAHSIALVLKWREWREAKADDDD